MRVAFVKFFPVCYLFVYDENFRMGEIGKGVGGRVECKECGI